MLKKSKKIFAGLLCLIMMMTLIPGNFVFGEEATPENDYLGVARKSQYVLYANSKENGIQLNGKNYVINGNVHSNSDVAAYLDKLDVRGKLETTGKVINYNNGVTQYIKKENAPERVLIDPSAYIVDSLGANPTVHEYWQTYSNPTVENTTPIQAKSGLQFCASNVKLKGTIMSNNDMGVYASEAFVSQGNEEVLLYSVNGNIQINAHDMEINGIIYAPNGTVQISGTNIKINGMIIAKKIQIGADNKLIINQNLNLKNAEAFKYYNDELQIYSEAEYDETTETINVNWESTFDEGKYEVYSSTDNKNFTLLGTVTGANTYAYKTNGSTNDIYFKVKQTLNNGFTKESNTVKMVYDVYKCQYVFEDTDIDSERLTDTYEFFLETDMNNVDTDGDDLTDYAEVFLTGTDPLYKDSDEDGVLDCDEDTDGDTLSNKYEMKLGTHPQKVDTDDDTLADNYEVAGIKIKGDDVNTYKTLPTNADTDGDTLSDSDEALLGLNPLSKDSDGDGILDCDEMFKQKVQPLEIENPNSAVKEVNLDINIAGNAEKNVEIESVMGKDTYSSAVVGLIGEPIRIEAKTKFDTATLTFKIDKTKLGSTNFNDIQMMWYNEDTGFYEYFNTTHDEANGTVSTKTTHFCTILLVNGKVFEESFSKDLYSSYKDTYSTKYEFNTIIAVDCSNNMIDIDPSRAIPGFDIKASNRLEIVTNILKDLNQYPKNKVSICTFNWDCFKRTDFINSYPSGSLQLASFISDFLYENFDAHYGVSITQMVNILKQNSTTRKEGNITYKTISKIIFISDGKEGIDEDARNALNYAKNNNIVIDTVAVPAKVSAPINETALQDIASSTKGTFYKAVNDRSLLVEYDGPTTTNYNFTTDSDNDKIPDTFEEAGMLCSNGEVIKTPYDRSQSATPNDADDDDLLDGDEVQLIPFNSLPPYIQIKAKTYFVDGVPSQYIFKKISDPHKKDSDGDGYEDKKDADPLKKPTEKKSYILYDETQQEFLKDEAFDREKRMKRNGINVGTFSISNQDDFKDAWNNMGLDSNNKGKYIIDEVITIFHGSPNGFGFIDNDDIIANNGTSILNNKKINTLLLSCCNCGNLDFLNPIKIGTTDYTQNVAITFLKKMPDIKCVKAWDGYSIYNITKLGAIEVGVSYGDTFSEIWNDSKEFQAWSVAKNGERRIPSQLITYTRDVNGNITFTPDEKFYIREHNTSKLYAFLAGPFFSSKLSDHVMAYFYPLPKKITERIN